MGNIFIFIPPTSGGGDTTAAYLLVSGSQPLADLPNARGITAQGVINLIDQGPGLNLIISASGVPGPTGPQGAAGGADPFASYLVMSLTSSLSNDRKATGSSGIGIIDGGAAGNATFVNTRPGDTFASYVVVASTASLPNDRVLTAGGGITLVDAGAGNPVTIAQAAAPMGNVFGGGLINQISSNYILSGGGVAFVSTSVGAFNISLPTPYTSGTLIIKDIQGSASINPFTVFPTGGRKIDNLSSSYQYYVNYGALKLLTDGVDWFTW